MKNQIGYLTVGVIVISLMGCGSPIENVPVITFNNYNVLQPVVEFETVEDDSVAITYWETSTNSKVFSKPSTGKDHRIPILNLLPETRYQYKIISLKSNKKSGKYSFTTGRLPASIAKIEKVKVNESLFAGNIFIRSYFKKGSDILLNSNGDVVWYHDYDSAIKRAFHWTHRNTILCTTDTSTVVEYDLRGNILAQFNFLNADKPRVIHHDLVLDKNNYVVAVKTDSVIRDLRKIGGKENAVLRGSGIIRAKLNGQIDWEWNVLDYVDYSKVYKSPLKTRMVVGHANSIFIDKDDHYIISFRDFNQVWKVNSVTGDVIWKIGENGDYSLNDERGFFVRQHSAHINSDGNLMVYDNGGSRERPYSRVLSLELNHEKREAKIKDALNLPGDFSSFRLCSAYLLDSKYYLISVRKNVVILDKTGNVLWHIKLDDATHRAYYLENPFKSYNE
jgi:arylsulfate sulfotransferase